MKKNIKLSVASIILAVLCVIPVSANAATVYLETAKSTISVGDTAIVSVKINADGAVLNTVEGDISLKSPATSLAVQEFSLANSAFGLWPRTPSLSKDGRSVSFVGGVPGGFSIEGATLFKIIVEAKKVGKIDISPENIAAYANDGKGTKVPVQLKGITMTVVANNAGTAVNNEWQAVVSTDKIAPEDFIVVAGQDSTLFNGQKFVFFSALDNQSGIDYYDVSENGAPAVRSGSTYVLKDQSGSAKLDVIAYDKAGNKKSASYPIKSEGISWGWIVTALLLGIVIRRVYKKRALKKQNASNNASPTL